MSKPMPAHHRAIDIPRAKIADSYDVTIRIGASPFPWVIVAAAPVDAANPPPAGMVRVIVAPARGPS